MADKAAIIAKRLLDVKLRELGTWVLARDFTPKGVFYASRRGKERFINKYIYVKNQGIGGIAMVLMGYVVISYIWSFEDHIKHDRWRKYH